MGTQPRSRLSGYLVAFILIFGLGFFRASAVRSDNIDPIVQAITRAAHLRVAAAPLFVFPATVNPDVAQLSRLQSLFEQFFPKKVNLIPVLRKIVIESTVAEIPNAGRVLYNPAHSLFIYLPENSKSTEEIRISTLDDVTSILNQTPTVIQPMAPYTRGFDVFDDLSRLMRDAKARSGLQAAWFDSPRSKADERRIQYLLLGPIQQSSTLATESTQCKQTINHFVDEIRAGKRSAIPPLPGFSNNVRPTNFVRYRSRFILVLSEALIARYYVIAALSATTTGCSLAWEQPFFVM